MLAEYFRFHGFVVVEAATGSEAVDKATTNLVDVVLLDLMLPDFDGFEVARRLRQSSHSATVPIVVHTAAVLGDMRERVANAGVTMFIPKPTAIELVVRQVLDLVRQHWAF